MFRSSSTFLSNTNIVVLENQGNGETNLNEATFGYVIRLTVVLRVAHWSSMYNIRSQQNYGQTNEKKQDYVAIPQT